MNILINGMEMPLPGQIVLVEIDENGDVFAAYDGGRTKLTQHKAAPVPAHGRLGDLDELYSHLNEWYLTNNPVFTKEESLYIRAMLLEIAEAPTIIPATK